MEDNLEQGIHDRRYNFLLAAWDHVWDGEAYVWLAHLFHSNFMYISVYYKYITPHDLYYLTNTLKST